MGYQTHNQGIVSGSLTTRVWGPDVDAATGVCGTTPTPSVASYSSPVLVVGSHSFIKLASGGNVGVNQWSLGLKANGEVWSWGYPNNGSLGDNTTTSKSSPVLVVGSHSFIDIDAGQYHALALKADGSCWAWGYNGDGELGVGVDRNNRSSPVLVVGSHSFVHIAAGGYSSCGLKADGSLWSWGWNSLGQLGTNTNVSYSSPVLVVGSHSFIDVSGSAGTMNYALKANGEIWSWGDNSYGQCAPTANPSSVSSPISVIGNHSFMSMAAGADTIFGLKSDGQVWSWGSGTVGALGNNSTANASSPITVVGAHSFIRIWSGPAASHVMAQKADGNIWTWGYNNYGQLGHNDRVSYSSPVLVVGNHSFTQMYLSTLVTIALKADTGAAWIWGDNSYGSLGTNDNVSRSSPVLVVGSHSFIAVSLGGNPAAGYGLKADGNVWAWGYNGNGECAQQFFQIFPNYSSPVLVVGSHSFIQAFQASASSSYGLKSDGAVWSWGANSSGQLGTGNTTSYSSPVLVVGSHSFISIAANTSGSTYGLKADTGAIWSWGYGTYGALGNNTTTDTQSPVLVVGSHSFVKVFATGAGGVGIKSDYMAWVWGLNASNYQCGMPFALNYSSPVLLVGNHSIKAVAGCSNVTAFLKTDGTVWCAGRGVFGAIGNNSTNTQSSPVAVVGNHSFVTISAAHASDAFFGLKADTGAVWSWGDNTTGMLGTGDRTNRSSPTLVVGTHSFVSLGPSNFARKSDGSLWVLGGSNSDGVLGTGNTTSYSSPVLVVGSHAFIAALPAEAPTGAKPLGIKSDGYAWGWGSNTSGQLGLWKTTEYADYKISYLSPVLVVGNHSFIKISGGSGAHCLALKANGEIWTWGSNSAGQLGHNDTVSYSSPVLVVGSHSFVDIAAAAGNNSVARKVDGSLWAWGDNTYGQLGEYTTTSRSSPIQVVGSHSFVDIFPGANGTRARKADTGIVWTWGINNQGQLGASITGLPVYSTSFLSPVLVVGSHSFAQITSGGVSHINALKLDGTLWSWGDNTIGQLAINSRDNKSSPVQAIGSHSFYKISTGAYHTTALKTDGTMWVCGQNLYGQLGTGNTTSYSSPVLVVGSHSFTSIWSGDGVHTLALKSNGSAWCWGAGSTGLYGGYASPQNTLPGNHSFIQLTAGASYTLALKANGEVWGWGTSTYGNLGNAPPVTSVSSPVAVVGNHSFIKISDGYAMGMGLKANGEIWSWGENNYGNLGDNSTGARSSPVLVVGNHSFIALNCTAYYSSIALKSDGSVWTWGYNNSGQLGDNTISQKNSPVAVVGSHSFIAISSGYSHNLALKASGEVWAWGSNTFGQLGNGNTTSALSPVLVVGNHSFISIGKAQNHSIALKADGSVWTWGIATGGCLGNNSTASASSPVLVVGSHSFISVSAGDTCSYGLKANGEIWSWGYNFTGCLGTGNTTSYSSPVLVVGSHSFIYLQAGENTVFALKADGSAWGWGANSNGIIGDNSRSNKSSPVLVVGSHSFTTIFTTQTTSTALKISDGSAWSWGTFALGNNPINTLSYSSPVLVVGTHSFIKIVAEKWTSHGLKADGSVWSWGYNAAGNLGANLATSYSSPVAVVGNHSFTDIISGELHTIGLKSNGALWGWGLHTSGQVGVHYSTSFSSPVTVVGAHSFIKCASGSGHSVALKSDGSTWTWGNNSSGQLGTNDTVARSSPVLVVGSHSFTQIFAGIGGSYMFGLKAGDGSAWGCGDGTYGQLGTGSFSVSRSSPVPVVGSHSFFTMAVGSYSTLALKADTGACWAWGANDYGQLGHNDRISYNSPVLVVGSHSFIAVTIGSSGTPACAAGLKANGEVWCWGDNTTGCCGQNSTTSSYSSPVLVVGSHSFIAVAAGTSGGGNAMYALKANGELWGWGSNNFGQLGINAAGDRSSPVLAVGSHSFIAVKGGNFNVIARKADGSLWTCGNNGGGILGDNSVTHRSSPVAVVGNHSFIEMSTAQAGLALKADTGACWAWGGGSYYAALGRDIPGAALYAASYNSPVIVIGPSSYAAISRGGNFALRSDGTCWTWGLNTYGQLGTNDRVSYSSPVLVVGAHSFIAIAASTDHSLGLKADGNIWAWGRNSSGQLGHNDAVSYSSPVLVVGSHSFIAIAAGQTYSSALKIDGTMWCWGANAAGTDAAMVGDTFWYIPRSSPVLVAGGNTFRSLVDTGLYSITELVWHYKFLGLSGSEIAKALGVPIAQVNKILGL